MISPDHNRATPLSDDNRVTPLRPSQDGISEAAFEGLKQLVNHEAEQGLLGSIFINNRAYDAVCDVLSYEDFAHPLHGQIYAAIGSIIGSGAVASPVTLRAFFDADPTLERFGGALYLARLAESAVTVINAYHYAMTIRDLASRRELVDVAQRLVNDAALPTPEREAAAIIEDTEHQLYVIAERGQHRAPRNLATIAAQVVRNAQDAHEAGGAIVVNTGLKEVDDILLGMGAGELVVLAGRPSMGKSAAAGTIAANAAKAEKRPMIFSLEMTAEELGQRWIAGETNIATERLRHGNLDMVEWQKLDEARANLSKLPIVIDDQPRMSVASMRQRARRQKRRGGLDLIIIDHLQLIRQGGRQEARRLEIGDATSSLKAVAKELEVPVLLLSQITRKVEEREDKRPTLADLKESGDIEQDADIVMFLYREEYYLTKAEPKKRSAESREAFTARYADWKVDCDRAKGLAEIIIAKKRQGRTGVAKVHFDAVRQRFENLARWEQPR